MRATRDVVAGMDSSRDVVAPKVCRPCKKAGRSGFVCRRCGIPCCEHYCSYKEAPSHRAAMIPATCSACLLSPSKQAASSSKRSQAESVHARRVADRLAEATGRKAWFYGWRGFAVHEHVILEPPSGAIREPDLAAARAFGEDPEAILRHLPNVGIYLRFRVP